MKDNEELYKDSYLPYIIRWGKITCWIALFIIFAPVLALIVAYDAKIPADAAFSGIVAILSASFAMYFADPLAVFPVLGTPGLYLTYLSGNSKQIRAPASLMAQEGAGVERGTPEGNIMSCIGVAVSVLISTVVLTIMIFIGNWIIDVLPETILKALPMLMPALFGALLGQQFLTRPRLAIAALALALLVRFLQNLGVFSILPFGGGYAPMLVCVFGTIAIGRFMKNKGMIQ